MALWAIPPTSAVVGCVSLSGANTNEIGDFGLVSAIPPAAFASLALLTVGFVLALLESRPRPWLLASHLVVFVLLLHGAPALVEPEPRFPTAWLHSGFAEYIGRTGGTLPELDARFNWPGFFAAAGFLSKGLGLDDPLPLLKWSPVVFNIVALPSVYAIAAMTTRDPRAPWLAAWLFVPANWVGQDYFSPQALAFVLFLAIIVVLLRYFAPAEFEGRLGVWARSKALSRLRSLVRAEDDPLPRPHRLDAAAVHIDRCLYALVLVMYVAIVWSHQLTPYFAVAASTALVLLGACRLRSLPLLMAVIATAFVSYKASPYWVGHLHDIFGGFGQVGSTVNSNVGSRVSGSATHEWAQRMRILMTVAVLGVAFVGAVRRWRRSATSVSLIVLAVIPYSALLLQDYGGEVLLRSYLFSLPFAAPLMAAAVVSPLGSGRRPAAIGCLLVTAGLLAGFFVARFGNEAFEMVRPGEATAVERLYRIAPAGSTFVSAGGNSPLRFRDVERFKYVSVPDRRLVPRFDLAFVRNRLSRNPRGGYLLVTRAQAEYAQLALGAGPGWESRIDRRLARAPGFKLVIANRDAHVYRLRASKKRSRNG
jgi:hypothetical protein